MLYIKQNICLESCQKYWKNQGISFVKEIVEVLRHPKTDVTWGTSVLGLRFLKGTSILDQDAHIGLLCNLQRTEMSSLDTIDNDNGKTYSNGQPGHTW